MGIGIYIAKFVAGGALVCIFAVISEVFAPKRFAGSSLPHRGVPSLAK
jgi:hypothetical protein